MLGVRPEHVRPWGDGLLGPIEGRVAYVEALGRETLVGIDTDAGERLVTVLEGRARLRVGEPLRLGLGRGRRAALHAVSRNSCTIRASPAPALQIRWGTPRSIRASPSSTSVRPRRRSRA